MTHGAMHAHGAHKKRMDPAQLASIQALESIANAEASSVAAAAAAAVKTSAAVATSAVATSKAAVVATPATSAAAVVAATGVKAAVTTAAATSQQPTAVVGPVLQQTASSSSAKAVTPTTSAVVHSTAVAVTPVTSSSATVKIVTSASRALTTASHSTSASAAAASGSSSGTSGGTVAGIVIGVIAALAVVGALVAFLYKKVKSRGYDEHTSAWKKMDNDDLTPFPAREKANVPDDEYYTGPGAGQQQQQQQLQHQQYYDQQRPDTVVASNFAGYGAGHTYTPYSDNTSPYPAYGQQAQSPAQQQQYPGQPQEAYPYHQGAMQQPVQQAYPQQYPNQYGGYERSAVTPIAAAGMQNPFEDGNYAQHQDPRGAGSPTNSTGSGPRQLVGPGQHYGASSSPVVAGVGAGGFPVPAPVPLGRPEPPSTYDDIAAAEMYADDRYADDHMAAPAPPVAVAALAPVTARDPPVAVGAMRPYTETDPYSPKTAVSDNEWAGDVHAHAQAFPQPPAAAAGHVVTSSFSAAPRGDSPMSHLSPLPEPTPLPTLTPMSPLMTPASFNHDDVPPVLPPITQLAAAVPSSQGHQLPTDADDDEETRRMYTEVARAAGVPDPNTSEDLTHPSTQPYRHGQPLTPLPEVATPQSGTIALEPEATRAAAATAPRPLPQTPLALSTGPPHGSSSNLSTRPVTAYDDDDAYGGI